MSNAPITWTPISELGIRGRGWDEQIHPYCRLPDYAEGVVTEAVWNLSRQSTGLYVDFVSDTPSLQARTRLRTDPNAADGYIKYLDLYCRDETGRWRWAGASVHGYLPSGETPLIEGLPAQRREWRLYLPLSYQVEEIELGVPAGAGLTTLPPDDRPPIALYGTSIVHGMRHVSRPGMCWPAIVGRRLDYPILNLGFSGSARCEPPLGEILAELDPVLFVVDPLPNMSAELVETNTGPFLRHLLEKHPDTPILMIEDRTHANAWLRPDYFPAQAAKRRAFRAIAEALKATGARLHYLPGDDLIGHDSEATTDSSHPSDLGAWRYADVVTPALTPALANRLQERHESPGSAMPKDVRPPPHTNRF